MKRLSAEQILFIHSRLIDETGGAHGVRDLGLLQSAAERPSSTFEGHDLYANIFQKSAALLESISQNHPFIDGNKRTAITSAGILLQMNGHVLNASQKEIVRFMVSVATKKLSFEDMVLWLKKHSTPRRS